VKYTTDAPTSAAPMTSAELTLSPRNTVAPTNANTGIRLSTIAAWVAPTREITELKIRKLAPYPATPTSVAASQNRGATAAGSGSAPLAQRAAAAPAAVSAATVNCQVVRASGSDPSSNRLATIVYRLALSTPPAISRSPVAVPWLAPGPASTIRPPTATSTASAAVTVMVSRSTSAASTTTSADSSPLSRAPWTALVIDNPSVSHR
jgi:hypothetical protein